MTMPFCFLTAETSINTLGRTMEWVSIEIFIFFVYLFTMVIYLLKSRFKSVGVNQSTQFEPLYMNYMIDRIISKIDFGCQESDRPNE